MHVVVDMHEVTTGPIGVHVAVLYYRLGRIHISVHTHRPIIIIMHVDLGYV